MNVTVSSDAAAKAMNNLEKSFFIVPPLMSMRMPAAASVCRTFGAPPGKCRDCRNGSADFRAVGKCQRQQIDIIPLQEHPEG
jgi:hypothetical protein